VADPTVTQLPNELNLTPLTADGLGQARPIMDWLTTFHLASVVLDPYTNESSWVLRAATRVLEQFRSSHARINFIVTAGEMDGVGPKRGTTTLRHYFESLHAANSKNR
jgi:hypothetical protein